MLIPQITPNIFKSLFKSCGQGLLGVPFWSKKAKKRPKEETSFMQKMPKKPQRRSKNRLLDPENPQNAPFQNGRPRKRAPGSPKSQQMPFLGKKGQTNKKKSQQNNAQKRAFGPRSTILSIVRERDSGSSRASRARFRNSGHPKCPFRLSKSIPSGARSALCERREHAASAIHKVKVTP